MFSLSRTLNVANLTLNALSFGCLLHSFWCWTCVCSMLLRKIAFSKSLLNNRLRS
ncbi:cell shape-determining protein MreC [Vibrio cholerae]|uniref:cell shape-determining protein MreC n=1 Tax=Vibrio cholerae TaxID=666 RepID=UPI0038B3EAD0